MEDDDVYPVHSLDDTKIFRSILMTWTIFFNDFLDADKLRVSLSRLLDIGDWRKIGGRLRLNAKGALEIHVPRSFTTERPAFSYSFKKVDTAVEDHAVAKQFPKPQGHVSIWPGPQEFCELATSSDAPVTLEDLLVEDTPQMSVHITAFTNATFVALSWPHTLMDVMGQRALLKAWSMVLAGRESEVPPVLGARDDILCALMNAPAQKSEEHVFKSKQLDGFALEKFGTSFEMLTGPSPETRTVCLSKRAMAYLRSQALEDLTFSDGDGEKPFMSDGDILTAWIVRAVATTLTRPCPMTALHTMNARFRLPLLKNAKGVYLQNMLVSGFTLFPSDVTSGPMGPIALRNRQHLMQQATELQVLGSLREQRLAGDNSTLIYSDADALLLPFTDWTKAKLFSVANFSPAVVCPGESSRTRSRLFVSIMGMDYGDNYWLTLTLSPLIWKNIEKSLQSLNQ
ncbi:hypothetical protein C7974DRAFT_463960 [Boeremia exigua]|uniref:uncharacterized protein n=1 Tax=Boeremia exigua TaxID=749465 RepID=UPI001E8ED13C|nr:uncharacterized protein C7974DRAFT_463960 [Boeremia exigua]KAH6625503.1 hypothetical protein C7974DRAFT_463960 [Boeremia exigua]